MFTGSWADAVAGATSAAINATTHNRIPLSPPVRPLRSGKVTTTTGVCQSSYVWRRTKDAFRDSFSRRQGSSTAGGEMDKGRFGQGGLFAGGVALAAVAAMAVTGAARAAADHGVYARDANGP